MDVKTYVTLLRVYSDPLSPLLIELSATVKMLDQPLSAQEKNTGTETKEMTERMAAVQGQILTAVDVFGQQVTRLLALYSKQADSLDIQENKGGRII